MKQFSKAALGQAERLDPREAAKQDTRNWINDVLEQLTGQVGGGQGGGRCSGGRLCSRSLGDQAHEDTGAVCFGAAHTIPQVAPAHQPQR